MFLETGEVEFGDTSYAGWGSLLAFLCRLGRKSRVVSLSHTPKTSPSLGLGPRGGQSREQLKTCGLFKHLHRDLGQGSEPLGPQFPQHPLAGLSLGQGSEQAVEAGSVLCPQMAVADPWSSVENLLLFPCHWRLRSGPIWGHAVWPGKCVLVVVLALCWDETMSHSCQGDTPAGALVSCPSSC